MPGGRRMPLNRGLRWMKRHIGARSPKAKKFAIAARVVSEGGRENSEIRMFGFTTFDFSFPGKPRSAEVIF